MRAVDTNVLVRLVMHDDEEQFAGAIAFVQRGVWASHVVLAEVAWVLRETYGLDHSATAVAIEMLLQQEQLFVQDPDVVAAALESYRGKPALGLADCLILEIARKAGHLPLGTFDRNLSKLEGTQRL